MADSDKNILITPNINEIDQPSIIFTGADNNPITLRTLDDGTLSFEASSGQLFSISDSLSGTIFSVNDVSGIPSIEVDDDGTIRLAEFGGNVLVGTATDDGNKMQIKGNLAVGYEGASSNPLIHLIEANDGWNIRHNGSDNTLRFSNVLGGTDHVIFSETGGITTSTFTGDLSGNATTASAWSTGRTIQLTGDVTGTSVAWDGSGNISFATTIAANSVALGTDTTGNYVQQGSTSGLGISGSVNSEGGTFTVSSNATTAATASTLVYRNSSADINCRLVRPNYQNQTTISGAIAYRVNTSTDNFIRFCSDTAAIRTFLDVATSGHTHQTITWGTGLSGTNYNGSTATTVNLDFSELTDMTGDIAGTTEFILQNGTTESRKAASEIKLSAFNNDSGFLSSETDTLATVTARGASTTQSCQFSNGTQSTVITNPDVSTQLLVQKDSSSELGIYASGLNGNTPSISFLKTEGTLAARGNLDSYSDHVLGAMYATVPLDLLGTGDWDSYTHSRASIRFVQDGGVHITGAIPSAIEFATAASSGSPTLGLRIDKDQNLDVTGSVNIGDGTADSRLVIKRLDSAVSDDIQFYNGTTRMGEIGTEDTTWLRINQETSKNIYTPRYIRADGGFFVDGTSLGINGSGVLMSSSLSGTYSQPVTLSNASNSFTGAFTGNLTGNASTATTATTAGTCTGNAATVTNGLYTTTSFGGDVSGTYNAIVVGNDSHTHAFNNLTSKTSGTGEYSTSSHLTSGRGSGGVSLTINDGYGNANVTFNHKGGVPEQNGNAARIEVNTDSTTNASMFFELKSGVTASTAVQTSTIMTLTETAITSGSGVSFVGDLNGNAATATDSTTLGGLALQTSGRNNVANQVMRTDTNGYAQMGWINTTSGTAGTIDRIYCSQDAYIRYLTPANFRTQVTDGVYATASHSHSNYIVNNANDTFTGKLSVGSTSARQAGMYGIYDSTKTGHIWSMGTSYVISATGVDFGNLYGFGYKHTNNATGGTMAGSHQAVWCINGTPKAAFGTNIWAAADVIAYSDIRVKDNIEPIKDSLNKVKRLGGYTYTRTDHDDPEKRHTGVIAQEVMEVLPEAVHGDEEGMYSVAYGNMVGLLIESIKELSSQVDELKQEIAVLKSK